MAGLALSSIGVIFGWGVGTTSEAPSSFTQIEECVSISGVTLSKDQLDATPLESKRKKYVGGHEDTGGELTTTFNISDVFEEQWGEMLEAYNGMTSAQAMWFCAYHPSRAKMNVYIVEPGSIPAPEYSVGSVLQAEILNVLVDLPDPIDAVKPTAPSTGDES